MPDDRRRYELVRAELRIMSPAGHPHGRVAMRIAWPLPGDAYAEVEGKVAEWLRSGARMVIVVDPSNRTVKIHRSLTDVAVLTEDDEIAGSEVVREWRLPVRRLFRD